MKKIAILIIFMLPIYVLATDFTFVQGGDGISWDDPGNWNPYGVPGEQDTLRIVSDSVRLNIVASAKVVFIYNNSPTSPKSAVLVITANGSLKISNGAMKIFGPTNNGPNIGLRNNGNIILITSTITVSAGYEAQNNQTGIITSSGNSYISNAGIFKNLSGGVIDMVDGNIDCLSNSGNIINRGIWSVHDANYGIINRYGGQILNTGTLEIYNISPGYGIENDNGYILNKGLLNIYNTTEQGIKEIENLSIGSMINDTTGIWIVKSAMLSYGDVSNYGNMQLSAFGEPSLETYGNFFNYDSLTVSINNTYAAIRSHGYFLNDTSAYLLSDKVYYEPPA